MLMQQVPKSKNYRQAKVCILYIVIQKLPILNSNNIIMQPADEKTQIVNRYSFPSFPSSVINLPLLYSIRLLITIALLLSLPCSAIATTLIVSSASNVVGTVTNYTFTFNNHSSPSVIRTQFSQWAPWKAQPYTSTYKYYLNSGSFANVNINCVTRSSVIQCTMPTPLSSLGSTIQLIATNINNPSSTKPYPITMYLTNSDGNSETVTSNLTVTSVPNSVIGVGSYNNVVGSISSNSNWILSFNNYFDFGTILRIQYDNRYLNFDFRRISGVAVTSPNATTDVGLITVRITSWSDTASGAKILSPITTTNPEAAITTTVSCFLETMQSGITYNIQSFTATYSVVASPYTALSLNTTILRAGLSAQALSLTAMTCPFTAKNNGTNSSSFSLLNFSTNDLVASTCTNGSTSSTTKSCRYNTTALPFSISAIKPAVDRTSIAITVTTYTYFSVLSNYFQLCSQTININNKPQDATLTFNNSKCSTGAIAGDNNNNTQMAIKVQSATSGDIVEVTLAAATMLTGWTRVGTNRIFRYNIVASNIINSTNILIPFPHQNPTLVTTNILSSLSIIRISSLIEYPLSTTTTPLSFALCPTTTPNSLQLVSLSLNSTLTFATVTTTLRFKNKFTDYASGDYLRIVYRNYESVIFLTNFQINGSLRANQNVNGTNSSCSIAAINDTTIFINNITKINQVTTINQFIVTGVTNPATIYPINSASAFQIIITLFTSNNLQRQQGLIQFSSSTTTSPYIYTPSVIVASISPLLPILTVGPTSFTLTLTNTIKPRLYQSLSQSSLLIKLPFTCSPQTNSNGTITSNPSWLSINSSVSINLANCTVGFLVASTALVDVKETVSGILATNGVYSLSLQCTDNCLACSTDKYCSKCANSSTGSTANLLYKGLCYSSCPSRTYLVINQSQCYDCHLSCLSCSGPSITQCLACPTNYYQKQINTTTIVNQTTVVDVKNICVSVCGDGATFNVEKNKCQPCQIDCLYCINTQYCYFCKEGATFVGTNVCDFLVCTSPCITCEGSMTNCTSCVADLYFYQFQCYGECPTNTYPSTTTQKQLVCLQITNPVLYFPATICSIVLVILVCICNTCIDRGMTADSSRRNINMLTYSSAILALMQLFGLFILLAFTFNSVTKGLAGAGFALWMICNILFGVYYFKVLRKDEAVMAIVQHMSSQSRCIYYATVVASIGVALRLYRLLYCGLFRGVAPYPIKKTKQSSLLKKRKDSEGKMINTINAIANNEKQDANISPMGKDNKGVTKQSPSIITKGQKTVNNGKNTSMSNKTVKNVDSKQQKVPQKVVKIEQQENTSQQSTEEHSKFELKRPYLIYITIGSMFASIFFLAAAINEITKNVYLGMLISGLDLLIVVIASVILTAFDMWAGVKKSYLIALDKGANNETMENLRAEQDEATQQKILNNAKTTQKVNKGISPNKNKEDDKKKKKKYSPPALNLKKSVSPPKQKVLSPHEKQLKEKAQKAKKLKSRYSDLYKKAKKPDDQPSSEDDRDELPDIKIFEDVEIFIGDDLEPARKIKKIKGEKDNKRMTSMQNMKRADNKSSLAKSSNATLAKNKLNWKLDDIFLGFKDSQEGSEYDKKTLKISNDRDDKNDKKQIYKLSGREQQKSSDQKQQHLSYINSLDRHKNQKKQQEEQAQQQQHIEQIASGENDANTKGNNEVIRPAN